MEVFVTGGEIGTPYGLDQCPSLCRCMMHTSYTYKLGVLSYASPRVRLGGKPVFTGFRANTQARLRSQLGIEEADRPETAAAH